MLADEFAQIRSQIAGLRDIVAGLIELQRATIETQPGGVVAESLLERCDQLRHCLDQSQPDAIAPIKATPPRVEELYVERLNVIEPDGTVRLVLCNTLHSPGHVMDGKVFGKHPGEREAGVYFYDDEGNECGGLIYGGKREGNQYSAGGSLTFDQYRQDQVLGLQHVDSEGRRQAGLKVWDRPDISIDQEAERYGHIFNMPDGPEKRQAIKRLKESGELPGALRVFVGKDWNQESVVNLYDKQARVRLRLIVNAAGTPAIEFLDEQGAVTTRFPNPSA